MAEIPLSVFAQIGAGGLGWALAGLAVYRIITGKLVPESLYREARETARTWQQAWEEERQKNSALLVPAVKAQLGVINALPKPAASLDSAPSSEEVQT